jgi:hypothetical protein
MEPPLFFYQGTGWSRHAELVEARRRVGAVRKIVWPVPASFDKLKMPYD